MILGELELRLLNKLRELGPVTPVRLLEHLEKELTISYSALATTLRRLEKKGMVQGRDLRGRSREFWVEEEDPVFQRQASKLSAQLVKAFGGRSALALTEGAKELSESELNSLIDSLEKLKYNEA